MVPATVSRAYTLQQVTYTLLRKISRKSPGKPPWGSDSTAQDIESTRFHFDTTGNQPLYPGPRRTASLCGASPCEGISTTPGSP